MMPQHGVFDDRIGLEDMLRFLMIMLVSNFLKGFNIQLTKTSSICTLMPFGTISFVFRFLIRHIW